MLRVGITGPIGGGKSYVSARLVARGFYVYDADSQAKRLVAEDAALRDRIVGLLGERAFLPSGEYDRKWVASQVFADQAKLKALNRLIHPVVLADFRRVAREYVAERMVFFESALLPEIAWCDILDCILVVTAPEVVREERVMGRDGSLRSEVQARMAAQVGEETYLNLADVELRNDGVADVEVELDRVLKLLSAE